MQRMWMQRGKRSERTEWWPQSHGRFFMPKGSVWNKKIMDSTCAGHNITDPEVHTSNLAHILFLLAINLEDNHRQFVVQQFHLLSPFSSPTRNAHHENMRILRWPSSILGAEFSIDIWREQSLRRLIQSHNLFPDLRESRPACSLPREEPANHVARNVTSNVARAERGSSNVGSLAELVAPGEGKRVGNGKNQRNSYTTRPSTSN